MALKPSFHRAFHFFKSLKRVACRNSKDILYSYHICSDIVDRLDYQPLFGKSARALIWGRTVDWIRESDGNRAYLVNEKELKHGMPVSCFQDLQSQVTAGEEELGQGKGQAEETEGILRQTAEQLNEVSL